MALTANAQSYTGTPFNGPHVAPCVIQAEDFDNGGEGVAYHDDFVGHQGGGEILYRPDENVEIENDNANDGYHIGWTNADEWLSYTVEAPKTGYYDFIFTWAIPSDGNVVTVSVDGVDAGSAVVPNTGDYAAYGEFTIPAVLLKAGTNVVRVTLQHGNFDKFEIVHSTAAKTIEELAPDLYYSFENPADYATPQIGAQPLVFYTRGDDQTIGTPGGAPTAASGPTADKNAILVPPELNFRIPNPAGAGLTSYTLLIDLRIPTDDNNWRGIFQPVIDNSIDCFLYHNNSNGSIGKRQYPNNSAILPFEWYRLVLAVDNTNPNDFKYQIYVNGELSNNITSILADEVTLGDYFWLFTDDLAIYDFDFETSGIAFWTKALTVDEIAKLGGTIKTDAVTVPYNGSPIELPGAFEAEDFDRGAAWFTADESLGGAANSLRTDVGLPIRNDDEFDFDYIILQSRSYVIYTVSVSESGVLYFSPGVGGVANGNLNISIDNSIVAQLRVVTEGEWLYPETQMTLPAGEHKLKLTYVGEGDLFVNDALFYTWSNAQYAGTPFNGPHVIPGVIQAEDYDNGGEGVAYHDNEAGHQGGGEIFYRPEEGIELEDDGKNDGYHIGWTNADEWMNYTVEVVETDVYDFIFTWAIPRDNVPMTVSVNGVIAGSAIIPNTGHYSVYGQFTVEAIRLTQGKNVITIALEHGNFDKFEVVKSTAIKQVGNGKVYASDGAIHVEGFSPSADVEVYNAVGQRIVKTSNVVEQTIGIKGKGLYIVRVTDKGQTSGFKLLVR
jgi:hypothetical protein